MRILNIKALVLMDGQKVMVHDDLYDEYDQECIVRVHKNFFPNPKNKKKLIEKPVKIVIENEEFTFVYDFVEGYINGKFTVYSLK